MKDSRATQKHQITHKLPFNQETLLRPPAHLRWAYHNGSTSCVWERKQMSSLTNRDKNQQNPCQLAYQKTTRKQCQRKFGFWSCNLFTSLAMTSNVTSHTSALLDHTPELWKMKRGLTLQAAELMGSAYSLTGSHCYASSTHKRNSSKVSRKKLCRGKSTIKRPCKQIKDC